MLIIFAVLSIGTMIFYSVPLGITFTIISIGYLIFILIVRNKFKNIKKTDEELSE
ncbi:MAG: hypothetical protein IJH39_11930 [Clostridia bacterium]|nr:hypothetical protein [Clostridia bacterium]